MSGTVDQRRQDRTELGELVSRMARGSEAALARFYDLTVGHAYALARCIVRDEAAATEVVEDAYLAAWREAKAGESGRGGALAWLLATVRRRALALVENRSDACLRDLGADADAFGRSDDCGIELTRAMDRGSAAAAALARLSPQACRMLGLAFFRGLTHQEISTVCELPLATVEAVMAQACLQLQRPAAVTESAA